MSDLRGLLEGLLGGAGGRGTTTAPRPGDTPWSNPRDAIGKPVPDASEAPWSGTPAPGSAAPGWKGGPGSSPGAKGAPAPATGEVPWKGMPAPPPPGSGSPFGEAPTGNFGPTIRGATDALGRMTGSQGAMVGGAAGGLLGMLLGRSGRTARMVGMAGLGYLAYQAYQAWQRSQQGRAAATAAPREQDFGPGALEGPRGQEFALTMIKAMVSAALADGHVDEQERQRIFGEMDRFNLSPGERQVIEDCLRLRPDPYAIAGLSRGPEQASQIYLASAMVCGGDAPIERSYLDALAGSLNLPPDLRAELDRQARG